MMMTGAANRNFEAAMRFVRSEYAEMLHPRASFVLLPRLHGGANGLCMRNIAIVNGKPARDAAGAIIHSGAYTISIAIRRRTVAEFVATIVHELTHVAQHESGRAIDETEAHSAGTSASRAYYRSI